MAAWACRALSVIAMIAYWSAATPVAAGGAYDVQSDSERSFDVGFSVKPTVGVIGDRYAVRFAVTKPTNVQVSVVSGDGRIIRHLAAGLLGTNAPAPFQKGTTAQLLVWDGKDDAGREAPKGSKVRVDLGLKARFDRIMEWEPPSLMSRGIAGIAADSQGNLYALQGCMFMKGVRRPELLAFDRKGGYVRTLAPFPANTPREGIPETPFVENDGGVREPVSESPAFLPGLAHSTRQAMAVAAGRLFAVQNVYWRTPKAPRRVVSINLDGSTAPGRYAGPLLPEKTSGTPATYLAVSPDGGAVYASGFTEGKPLHAVYRAAWTNDRMEAWAGRLKEPGGDDRHFNDPRGLALDSEGRLWVCDYGNDRIQVFSSDGTLVKSLPVKGPDQVCVHPKTGAAYVLGVKEHTTSSEFGTTWQDYRKKALLRFAGVDKWEQQSALDLPERALHMHDAGPIVVLDSSQTEPIVWIANVGKHEAKSLTGMDDYLWRIADRDGKLVRVETLIPSYNLPRGQWTGALAVDRDREQLYFAGPAVPGVFRADGRTGKFANLDAIGRDLWGEQGKPNRTLTWGELQVADIAIGRDNMLYLRLRREDRESLIRRYDSDGRRVPFAKAGGEIVLRYPSHGFHPNGLAVAHDGSIFVVNLAPGEKVRGKTEHNTLDVYSADGEPAASGGMPWLSSGVWGPRLGPGGEIYLSESLRPRGLPRDDAVKGFMMFAPPFNGYLIASETRGSLVKFSGAKPAIRFGDGVDATAARYEVRQSENNFAPAVLNGADWVYFGMSPVPGGHCVCPGAAFDVDGFGRAAIPDAEHFRVKLLDAAGNLMLTFGAYGNRDSHRPGLGVDVPDIPLLSPYVAALSDEAVYSYDAHNRQIVRVRLSGVVVGECAVE